MKQVMIIVRPGCYFKTKQALSDNRFFAMSTKEVLGRGKAFVHFTSGEGKETSVVNEVYVTTAKTDEEARELLRLFNMPFEK